MGTLPTRGTWDYICGGCSEQTTQAEAAEEFSKLLQNACAQNKHILVLANKQDLPEALPSDVVDAELPLHALPYSLYVPCIQHFARCSLAMWFKECELF
jgi:signal recognition particle receptor subunit beta